MPKRQRLQRRSSVGEYIYDTVVSGGRRMYRAAAATGARRLQMAAEGLGEGIGNAAGNMFAAGGAAAQRAMFGAAEKATSGLAGAAAMDIGENPILPSQLIPGRGAELSSSGMLVLSPIKFKTGETSGPLLTDAHGREKLLYKPQSVMQAFAFKMQLQVPDYIRDEYESPPVTRYVVHNVFRHVLAGPNNTFDTELAYGPNTQLWNSTLGPDRSYVRRIGGTSPNANAPGSAYNVPPTSSGLVDSLTSPFRYPRNGEFMFARMTRQLIENLGWNANPMKILSRHPGSGDPDGTHPLQVYGSAQPSTNGAIISLPHITPGDWDVADSKGPAFMYKSQNSAGKVSYNFSNDGTNPVCVEIVITRVKKGNQLITGELKNTMVQCYELGYMNYSYANRNQANFSGAAPTPYDVTTNSRGPFLPAKALDNYKLTTNITGAQHNEGQHPWKQVARDQFIVSAGSTRNWSTSLQALDYYASRFSQYQAPAPTDEQVLEGYDDPSNCVDEMSYVFSIAVSGVPAPYIEYNKGTNYPLATASLASVLDRRGTACSVSVTGAYKEVCHPVYLSQVNTDTFINGRLDVPMYDFPLAPSLVPQLTTNDIANIGQAVRTSDPQSALIGMGPFNTVGGG